MPQMRDPRTYAIIGAGMEVHSQLASGYLESVYQEALEFELSGAGIPFESQVPLTLVYKGQELRSRFRPDLVCYGSVVVELKAQKSIGDVEAAQVINYLKLTGLEVGLLLNFGAERLQYERFANKWRGTSAPSAPSLLPGADEGNPTGSRATSAST